MRFYCGLLQNLLKRYVGPRGEYAPRLYADLYAVQVNAHRATMIGQIEALAIALVSNGDCKKWFEKAEPRIAQVCGCNARLQCASIVMCVDYCCRHRRL